MSDQDPLLPPPASANARVGVAALSGPVEAGALGRGLAALERFGFRVQEAANLRALDGFLAGSDEERLRSFHDLLRSDVDAVFFARGGHGVLRIIDQIDWDLLEQRPRWFIGYSDLTPLLLEITRRTGWLTVHGPMVAPDLGRGLDHRERNALLDAVRGTYRQSWRLHGSEPSTRGSMSIEGPLIGGCLAMICSTLGTAYDPRSLFDNAIVFLEDVGEAPYQVDRLLCQLELCGLERASAVVFGHCREHRGAGAQGSTECDHSDSSRGTASTLVDRGVLDVLVDHEQRLGIPVFHGIDAGHGVPNIALPIGAQARIDDGVLLVSTSALE